MSRKLAQEQQRITGGCLCGAVRYEAGEPPYKVGYCHCRMCQKTSGAPVAVGVYFNEQAVQFTKGEPKYYRSSEVAERGFCEHCGSRLVYRPLGTKSVSIDVGSLDNPEVAPPQYHIWVESQITWFTLDDELPRRSSDG